jgi:hypothetical protein
MAHSPTGPVPNHLIRSQFTPPDRAPFEPASLRAVLKPLNMRPSYIRTKMPVVRLCQRRWPLRARKRPKIWPQASSRGSEETPQMPAFCGVPTADRERKRMSRMGRLAERRGFEHSVTEALQAPSSHSALRQGCSGRRLVGLVLRTLEGGAAGTGVIAITQVLRGTAQSPAQQAAPPAKRGIFLAYSAGATCAGLLDRVPVPHALICASAQAHSEDSA